MTDANVSIVGPVLLEDYQLVEKIAQFDRERIPERVVHARGASAKGFFEVLGLTKTESFLASSFDQSNEQIVESYWLHILR